MFRDLIRPGALAAVFASCACLPCASTWAQLSKLPANTPPSIKQDLETLQRYADEVNRRSGRREQEPAPATAPATTPATPAPSALALAPAPAPAVSGATIGRSERDPFEVSPRLRESSRRTRAGAAGGTGSSVVVGAINRDLRIRAMARGPEGGIAQIEADKEVITVRDGDELELDGIRYMVHIGRDSVVLRGAGAPQYRMLVR